MAGPIIYEASVPFFIKALKNQLLLLERGKEWCKENSHEESKLTAATLATDMSSLPFHVEFCTYNAVQLLIDFKIVERESLPIEGEQQTFDQLTKRVQTALDILEAVPKPAFAEKEDAKVDVFLGHFTLNSDALKYVHEISLPSFWFHHSMVYSILRSQGVPLTKKLFLSAW